MSVPTLVVLATTLAMTILGVSPPHAGDGAPRRPLHVFTGSAEASRFGMAVAHAGDVDGDGCPDLIVGAPMEEIDGEKRGIVRVFSGRAGREPPSGTRAPPVRSRSDAPSGTANRAIPRPDDPRRRVAGAGRGVQSVPAQPPGDRGTEEPGGRGGLPLLVLLRGVAGGLSGGRRWQGPRHQEDRLQGRTLRRRFCRLCQAAVPAQTATLSS